MIVTPYLHNLCFRQKGEIIVLLLLNPLVDSLFRTKRGRRIYWFVFTWTPLLMIDKKGRGIWFICIFYMHVLFISLSFNCLIGIKMLHWHIFNWYHVFKVTPYWLCFCFRQIGGDWQKGGERFLPLINILFIVLIVYPFVDDWQKGGERFWVYMFLYMHIYVFAYIKFNIV